MARENAEIVLSDGTVYKAQDLYERLEANLPPVVFGLPAPGETLVYELEAGRQYELRTDADGHPHAVEENVTDSVKLIHT